MGHDAEEVKDGHVTNARIRKSDRYGLDLDVYNWLEEHERDRLRGARRKPYGWKRAVAQASEVILSDMYVLLELHYDNVYLEEWSEGSKRAGARPVSRASNRTVFEKVANAARKGLNQKL